ncbi:hypothetical protein DRE_06622 [Drechslerella stenobrocha 248]|uniref:PH domain-containing protein n=1 Tax=Drechslerella stenobrocha 248 TaxID=1043628 RepID=W7HXI8_9PEZI|nr:hypothetical protein DRE_06622 [Drechslerella stenobrocha 248]
MSYNQHHQYLHSSVLPSLVGPESRMRPRPLSEATSIASSIDFEDTTILLSPHTRISKAPTYRYSAYDDMDLPEEQEEEYIIDDIIEEEDQEGDGTMHRGNLYSKAIIMSSWLADGARDSVGSDGMKTASSCDEAKTPTTPPLDFGAPQEMTMKRSTVGPRGPHLFSSMFLQAHQSDEHIDDDCLSPISPIHESPYSSPYSRRSPIGSQYSFQHVPQLSPQHRQLSVDVNERPLSAMSMALEDVDESEIEHWSPIRVCEWMHELGFEGSLVEKFRQNDISGAILMQLKWEDLKELDIQSLGKRIELWSELNHLRKSPIVSGTSPKKELSFETSSVHSPPLLSKHASRRSRESKFRQSPNPSASPSSYTSSPSTITRSNTIATTRPSAPAPRKLPILRISTDVASLQMRPRPRLEVSAPPESDNEEESEEEIEEVDKFSDPEDEEQNSALPMAEKRRPTGLSIIIPDSALEVPPSLNSADSKSSHDGHSQASRKGKPAPRFTAHNPAKRRVSKRLSTPISPVSASIDIFAAPSILGLTKGKRLTMLEAESPMWGNDESHIRSPWAPSICASSDVLSPSDRGDVRLKADELRKVSALSTQEQINKFITLQHLQRLEERAPSSLKNETIREASPLSAQSILSVKSQPAMTKVVQRSVSLRNLDRHKPRPLQLSDESVPSGPASAGFTSWNDDTKNSLLPGSTQPIVAQRPTPSFLRSATSPSPPLASQSTPALVRPAPVGSPKSTQEATMARSNSISGASKKASNNGSSKKPRSLGKSIIDTVNEEVEWEDASSHGSAPASPSERVFTGEMKKRANHFLRNEWVNHRVELRGTKFTIYKSTIGREVLTTLEIDDFSVTCTTAGSNKFKGLKTGSKKDSDGMYHFQLVPNQGKKTGEPKKEHHFAVSSREERIDWMRELMLAKAIKQKQSGFQVAVNGLMV